MSKGKEKGGVEYYQYGYYYLPLDKNERIIRRISMSETTVTINEKIYMVTPVEVGESNICKLCCFYEEGKQTSCPILSDEKECSEINLCFCTKIDGRHTYFTHKSG
jgi:hypothetical protein